MSRMGIYHYILILLQKDKEKKKKNKILRISIQNGQSNKL